MINSSRKDEEGGIRNEEGSEKAERAGEGGSEPAGRLTQFGPANPAFETCFRPEIGSIGGAD